MIEKTSPVVVLDKSEIIEYAKVLSVELGTEVKPTFDVIALKARDKKSR
jgi:hypothetical protein